MLVHDRQIMQHQAFNNRVAVKGGEYLHAIARVSGDEIEFEPLLYRPSQYPSKDISDLEFFEYVNGTEHKLWAIKDAGNNQAHVFYQNDQSDQRLVYQLVDLGLESISTRQAKKTQNGYVQIANPYEYFASTRTLDIQIPF